MNGILDAAHILEYGALLLPAMLSLSSKDDVLLVAELYNEYKLLMYKICRKYFNEDTAEVNEAFSAALESICKKISQIKAVDCNKRGTYIVILTENVCRTRIRSRARKSSLLIEYADEAAFSDVPDMSDVHTEAFGRADAIDMLNAFPELNEKDKELIRMRHIDMMTLSEIAAELCMSEGSVRTALSRAKSKLVSIGKKLKGGEQDE